MTTLILVIQNVSLYCKVMVVEASMHGYLSCMLFCDTHYAGDPLHI